MLESGTRLGPYEILSAIGAGGMGEVYKARDTRLDRTVAVKVLPAHLSENPTVRERFEREARAISAITHPNICTLFDVGSEGGISFLVMEYLEGESLADRLGRGPLPIDAVLRYGVEIADALERAHRQGVVHRDLKPANVMITRGGAKLLDFGLARHSADGTGAISGLTDAATAHRALTAEGQIVGTFQYMAPEQLEGQPADARTDVFALGLVLYEMLTGRRAFDGKTRTSVIAKIVSGEPEPVSEVQPLTPPTLERVIRTCIAKDPEDRWQTAHDVKLALKSVGEERSTPAALRARSPRSRTRKWLPWIVAAAAAIAAVAFGISWARRPVHAPSIIRFGVAEPPDRVLGALAVSPDGQRIAAALTTLDDKRQLVIRDLAAVDFRPLLLTLGSERPHFAWSPDSRSLAFVMNQRVVRTDLASGKPEVISAGSYGVGMAWLENGTVVFARRFGEGLFAVPATGGEPRALTKLDLGKGETLHGWPAVVPGHPDLVLYLRRTTPSVRSIVRLLNIADGKSTDIVEADALVGATAKDLYYVRASVLLRQPFSPGKRSVSGKAEIVADNVSYSELWADAEASIDRDGRTIAYANHKVDRTAFRWFDREGRSLGDLAIENDADAPRLSPDGRWMASMRFEAEHGAGEIWVRDLVRGIESRLTNHPSSDEEPFWSPGSRELIFNTDRFGLYGAAIVPANGSAEARTLVAPINNCDTWVRDVAPDGTLLLEVSSPATNADLWVAPIGNVRAAKPFLATRTFEENGTFSPDGRWIAYNSAASGRREVYIVSHPRPDSRYQISTNGGSQPRWSRDGSEVIFESAGSIVSVPIIRRGNELEPGVPRTLFKTPANTIPGEDGIAFDISSDGKKLLIPILIDGRKPRNMQVIAVR